MISKLNNSFSDNISFSVKDKRWMIYILVIIAIFVLIAGIVLANFVKRLIKSSTAVLNIKPAGFLANLARIALIVFTVLISLNIIGFNSDIINIIFMGAVAMIALAGGLAFGLGGQKAAAEAIEDIKRTMHK